MFFKSSNESVLSTEVNFSKRSSQNNSNFEIPRDFVSREKKNQQWEKNTFCTFWNMFYLSITLSIYNLVSCNARNQLGGAISDSTTE